MRKLIVLLCLLWAVAGLAQTPSVPIYIEQGGAKMVVGSGGTLQLDSGSTFTSAVAPSYTAGLTVTGGTVSLNADASANTCNVGTGAAAKTVTVGSATTTSATTIQSGTGDITITSTDDMNIGANAVAQDITLGNETGATSLTIHAGTGNIAMDGVAATTITIGDAAQTGTISVGTSSATNTLNLGTGNGNKTIAIGTGTGTNGISIGNGAGVITTTLGSTNGASATTINSGTGDLALVSTDDITLTTNTAATDNITITNTQGNTANAVQVTAAAGGITLSPHTSNYVTIDGPAKTSYGVGTAATGMSAVCKINTVRSAVLTFTLTGANDVDVEDGGKTKGKKIFDFPEGKILVLGATIDASITTNAAYNAHANDDYYVSIGTVDGTQAADADLTSTEADIIPKTTIATDTSGANTNLTANWHNSMGTLAYANNAFDGTTTPTALYVNVAVPDAANTGATTHAITGTITVTYANLGDY